MALPLAIPLVQWAIGVGGTIFGGAKLANFFIDQRLNVDRAKIIEQSEADIRRAAGGNTPLAQRQIEQLHRDIAGLIKSQEREKLGAEADWIRIASYVGVGIALFGAAYLVRSFRASPPAVVLQMTGGNEGSRRAVNRRI